MKVENNVNAKIVSSIVELKPLITKNMVIDKITQSAKEAHEMNATQFLLYYSGHGNEKGGAWRCSVGDGGMAFFEEEYLIQI